MTNPAPDYELLVSQRLTDALSIPESKMGRNMPARDDFSPTDVYYRIRHVDGQGDDVFLYPVIDIDVFTARVADAKRLANAVEAELVGYARSVQIDGKTYAIGKAEAIRSPVEVPDDSRTARWGATYELPLRR